MSALSRTLALTWMMRSQCRALNRRFMFFLKNSSRSCHLVLNVSKHFLNTEHVLTHLILQKTFTKDEETDTREVSTPTPSYNKPEMSADIAKCFLAENCPWLETTARVLPSTPSATVPAWAHTPLTMMLVTASRLAPCPLHSTLHCTSYHATLPALKSSMTLIVLRINAKPHGP